MTSEWLKAIKIGVDAARGPYVEAEISPDRLFKPRALASGLLKLFIFTVEGSVPEDKYMKFLDIIAYNAKSRGCSVRAMKPPGIIAYCDSKALLQTWGSTLADEIGLPDDLDSDEPDEIMEELGLGPIKPYETYIFVEINITLPLLWLNWIKDNIAWLLASMDLLDVRYQAKIEVNKPPRRPDALEPMRSNGVSIMYAGGSTSLHLPGAHHLRDPKLYDILRKAFLARRWF